MGSVTYGLGADLSLPHCLSVTTGIWTLAHKSDPRAEISGEIVWYDALAPRPEVLLSWYFVCACAILQELKFLPYSWGKIFAKGQVPDAVISIYSCQFTGSYTVHCPSKRCMVEFRSIFFFTVSNLLFSWKRRAVLLQYKFMTCTCTRKSRQSHSLEPIYLSSEAVIRNRFCRLVGGSLGVKAPYMEFPFISHSLSPQL